MGIELAKAEKKKKRKGRSNYCFPQNEIKSRKIYKVDYEKGYFVKRLCPTFFVFINLPKKKQLRTV